MKKLLLVIFMFAGLVSAQIPKTLSYQGILTNNDGEALKGKQSVTFNFYENAEGGKSIWQESHALMITDGFFETILGSKNELNLPFNKPYWLGITVGSSEELTPRIQLNSAPYSLLAGTVSDSSITRKKIADKQVVRSVNSITDDLIIAAGDNVKIIQKGDSLIISAINEPDKLIKTEGSYKDRDDHRKKTVYSLNRLSGHLKLEATGGAVVSEKDENTIMIEAGNGTIKEIQNPDSSLIITNPEGPITQINIRPGGVSGSDLADYAVTTLKIAVGAVTSAAIKDSSVTNDDLAPDAVASDNLQDNSVVTIKIAPAAVDSNRIAADAVVTSKIKDGAITQSKIDASVAFPASGVAGGDLSGNFPNPLIKENAINSAKIADGSIAEADLAANAVSTAKLSDNAVTGVKIADGTVTQLDIADNAVTTSKIADLSITQSKLDPTIVLPAGGPAGGDLEGTYPNPVIKASSVTSSKIADGAILEIDLADNAVSGVKIIDGTVGTSDLASGSVNASKIAAGSVVRSLNNLRDDVTLAAGANITISQSGNVLTLSGIPTIDNDWTVSGSNIFSTVPGNVGIGVTNPSQKLDVNGVVRMAGMQMQAGAADGYVLTSDAAGMASWQPFAAGGIGGAGTTGFLPFFDTPTTLANSVVTQSADKIGISVAAPFAKLDVASSTDVYTGRFTNQRLSLATHIVHAEYNGASGNQNVVAVYGKSEPSDGYGYGGYFQAGRFGVAGNVYPTGTSSYIGTRGYVYGGNGYNYGLHGYAYGNVVNYGTYGAAIGPSNSVNYGIYGYASGGASNYAGYFFGTLYAQTIEGGVKNFKIDHPLDPENKYLYHSSVESAEMLNIYNGNVTLDKKGEAVVTLPDWFDRVNKDFRYQLTCIGGFAQVYIAEKITNNRFRIAGGNPGLEVSWQVSGVRNDPVASLNKMQVEQNKPEFERGKYLVPAAYGKPESMGVGYETLRNLEEVNKQRDLRSEQN